MSSLYSLTKTLKACLFTTALYGWLIPTAWIADQLNELMPSRQLTSTDWVIESGQPNTSWDLVTIDGPELSEQPEEELELQTEEWVTPTANPNLDKTSPKPSESDYDSSSETEQLIGTKSKEGSDNTPITSTETARNPLAKGLPNHISKRFNSQKTARKGKCEVENPNITRAGNNSYTLPKSTLKHYSTHWKDASKLAHLTWAMQKDGSRLGIRIRGISCRSPLKFTGIRHGDVVLSINNHTVQSEKDLLKVYSRLLFWKKVDVKVKRGGKTLTLKYKIT